MIDRATLNGRLQLEDDASLETCATCNATSPIGVTVETGGRRLRTAMCATCITEALAIFWGRRHVQAGGDVADLKVTPEAPSDA